jgi:hypothetical protein
MDSGACDIAGDVEPLTSEYVSVVAASRNWLDLFYTQAERADISRAGLDGGGFAALVAASAKATPVASTPAARRARRLQPPPMPRKGDLAATVRDRLNTLEQLLSARLRHPTAAAASTPATPPPPPPPRAPPRRTRRRLRASRRFRWTFSSTWRT